MHEPDTKPAKTGRSLSATFSIDLKNRFVLVKFAGRVTFHDIEGYALDLRAHPRFSPSLSEIVDLRDVEKVELSPKEAMNLSLIHI